MYYSEPKKKTAKWNQAVFKRTLTTSNPHLVEKKTLVHSFSSRYLEIFLDADECDKKRIRYITVDAA